MITGSLVFFAKASLKSHLTITTSQLSLKSPRPKASSLTSRH